MTVVVTFQRFANWKNDTAIYSQNPDDDFGELVMEIISNPIRDEQNEIDLDFISAFNRCPKDHAIFVYETDIPAHELIEHKDTFYVEKHDNFNLVYATPVGFPDCTTSTVFLDNDVVSFSLNSSQAHLLYCILHNSSARQDTESLALDNLRDQLRDILPRIR